MCIEFHEVTFSRHTQNGVKHILYHVVTIKNFGTIGCYIVLLLYLTYGYTIDYPKI